MTCTEPTLTTDHRTARTARTTTTTTTALTAYGCDADEAALFRELAPQYGVRLALTDVPLDASNAVLAAGSRCVSVGHKAPVDVRALSALARVGVEHLVTRSIGTNHIDVGCAERIGITVGTVAYSPDSVADYTLMLALMLVRGARSVIGRADGHDYRLSEVRGRELRDLTVGVVGTGRIGGAVVDRLRGFGGRVLTHDRLASSGDDVPLEDLLRHSDLVTLHVPLDAGSHHLLDRRRLALLPRGAYVVNTARGGLVDTEALVTALEEGRLGGAALDVVEGEEGIFYADRRAVPVTHAALLRLHRLPNVLISPHTAFYTDHALRDLVEGTLAGCVAHARRHRG